jgi:hypothetical protein
MKKIFILILFVGLINLYPQDMQAETFSSSLVCEENEYDNDHDDDHDEDYNDDDDDDYNDDDDDDYNDDDDDDDDDDYNDDDDDECPSLPISNQKGLFILIVSGIVLAFLSKARKQKQI